MNFNIIITSITFPANRFLGGDFNHPSVEETEVLFSFSNDSDEAEYMSADDEVTDEIMMSIMRCHLIASQNYEANWKSTRTNGCRWASELLLLLLLVDFE